MNVRLPVQEIYGPTIQGEGLLIGRKTFFVRLAGCDYSCSWCDSEFTWRKEKLAPITRMTPNEIVDRLIRLGPGGNLVTISGGNPVLHDLSELIDSIGKVGFAVNIETQGSIVREWMARADIVTISPKPPSSGMTTNWSVLDECVRVSRSVCLKVVVFDEEDYEYAVAVHRRYPNIHFVMQVGNFVGRDEPSELLSRLTWLAEKAACDHRVASIYVLPQLHVLIWGNKRGV